MTATLRTYPMCVQSKASGGPSFGKQANEPRLCRAPIQPSGLDHSSMLTTSKSSSIAARFVQTRQGLALDDCHFQLAAKLAAAIAAQSWHTSQRHTLLEKCPVRKLCLCFLVDDFCPPLGSLALGAINSRLLATLRLRKWFPWTRVPKMLFS